jgi:plastocyanin
MPYRFLSSWCALGRGFVGLASLALIAACSSSPSTEKPSESGAGAAADPKRVFGRAPAAIGNFSAIVALEPIGVTAPPQMTVPVMDQVQQSFIPGLLVVQVGQPVEFRNNDDVLHNVKVREDATRESAFNVAIPTGEKFIYAFSRDGFYDVGCDIHPGMSAQIMATSTPFSTIADPQGQFALDGIPAGQYKAVAFSGDKKIERTITVPMTTSLDLTKP